MHISFHFPLQVQAKISSSDLVDCIPVMTNLTIASFKELLHSCSHKIQPFEVVQKL